MYIFIWGQHLEDYNDAKMSEEIKAMSEVVLYAMLAC